MLRIDRICDEINSIKNLKGVCYIELNDDTYIKVKANVFVEKSIFDNIAIKDRCYITIVKIIDIKGVY